MASKKNEEKPQTLVSELKPWPSYIEDRITLWNKLKKKQDAELDNKVNKPIIITYPDGITVDGLSWKSTPYDLAKAISQELADNSIVAKVNGKLWDMDRPLEKDSSVKFLNIDDDDARHVFWNSSAHILGEAMERIYGGCLCYGSPIEEGFYYDMFIGGKEMSNFDYPVIENVVKSIIKEKQPFERLEVSIIDLLEMFKYNQFKMKILSEKVTTPKTTIYRCGPLIDLCRGPHIRNTGTVKAFKVFKNLPTNWEGNAQGESLQRVYGISFLENKQLREWTTFQNKAAKRDHCKIGKEQELFFFHELSPGSCFFQPNGTHIYNTLIGFLKSEYRKYGISEVISPNIYNNKLWQLSGHWKHFADNMFSFDMEKESNSLKPMNCPGHCLMFAQRSRSWKELPLRMADFSVLHRNELSSALTGLTRVRQFQQDDTHIFCTDNQIGQEMMDSLNFLRHVYTVFGFTFNLRLSTRPKVYQGDLKMWKNAEKKLTDSLTEFGEPWSLNPGDGVFYGPKIDITISDALKRQHQCATIQLDFQLPINFNLSYVGESGEKKRPVIIHRAIFGSVERMIAILTESFAGKWPFWLSPRQAVVIPISGQFDEYAETVKKQIFDAGFMCDVNVDHNDTLNKKIRNARVALYNYILVVGESEKSKNTVNLRTRNNNILGEISIEETIEKFTELKISKTNSDTE